MPEENENQNESESPNVKQMREALENKDERIQKLEGALRLSAFKEAGINPEQGIGKAIYRTYDGEINPEQIKTFAKEEYDVEVGNENTGGQNEETQQGVPASQQRTQQTMQSGKHEDPPSALDKADEAASEGDWVTSAAMKDKELMNVAKNKFAF